MDRVRLGRVLGRGARVAARTVYDAVDAATSPDPLAREQGTAAGTSPNTSCNTAPGTTRKAAPGTAQRTRPVSRLPVTAPSTVPPAVSQAVRAVGRVQGSARAARQGVLAPVKRASRALSLEMAGSFYALFALSFSIAAWRLRTSAQGSDKQHLLVCLLLAGLFGYFAVSSFLRARQISRV